MLEKKCYSYEAKEERAILEQVESEIYQYDYISDGFMEIVDSNIDVYYTGLRQWSVENYNYIEEAMEEGLCEGVTDFHALIQAGQYQRFSSLIYENEKELYYNILLEILLNNVEEEIITLYEAELEDALEAIVDEIDNNDGGSIFEEKINELLEEKKEEYEEQQEENKED